MQAVIPDFTVRAAGGAVGSGIFVGGARVLAVGDVVIARGEGIGSTGLRN